MTRTRFLLSILVVFLIGFGLVEIAILGTLALAISVGQLLTVGVLTLAGAHSMYEIRAGLRREMIYLDGMRAVDDALSQRDYELAVGALLEWDQTLKHELAMQEAHPWSPVRFWNFPPGYREDWD